MCPKNEPTRQMVLGTDNQEKEAPHEDSPLMKFTHKNRRRPIRFFFFLFLPVITVFQMGNNQSTSQQMPLRCILDNWKLFNPLTLRRSCLKFFCATVWPQYPLGDKEHWPEDGSLNYNTILQLDLFCKRQGKWTEIPYVQIFFQLRDMKELCLKYGIVVCPKSEPTRQRVLGPDNQEKEPPPPLPAPKGLPLMAPEQLGAPSLHPTVPPYPGPPAP